MENRVALTFGAARFGACHNREHPMNDLQNLIPRDKFDIKRARAAIEAGFPAVEPILPDLLWWIADMNWPVADELLPFFRSIGLPLAPHLRAIFATNDGEWKNWILTLILAEDGELTHALRSEIERIAFDPTRDEAAEEMPETARKILNTSDET